MAFNKRGIGLGIVMLGLMAVGSSAYGKHLIVNQLLPDSIGIDTTAITHQLPDVTVSSFVIGNNLQKSTGAVVVLDAKHLSKFSAVSIPDALNLAPGIVAQSGSAGTQKIMVRGIGSRSAYGTNRIKGYFGQIPLTTADGVTSFDELDLWSVGRADIVKGPSSALYGAGLGGAIVFKPIDNEATKGMGVKLQTGAFGYYKLAANTNISNNKHRLAAGISKGQSDGYRQNSASEHLAGHAVWRFTGKKTSTDVLLAISDFHAQIPSSLNADQAKNNPKMAAPNWYAVKGYEKNKKILAGTTFGYQLGNQWMAWATVYANGQKGHEHRPFNVLDDQSGMLGAKAQIDKHFTNSKLSIGVERIGEWYDAQFFETSGTEQGDELGENHQYRTQNNGYAWWSYWPTDKLTITAGANINSLKYSMTDGANLDESHRFDPVLSPRLGVNYNLVKGHYLYSSVGHGLSHPSTEETLMPPGSINRELKPEQGNTVELGAKGLISRLNVSYELSAYIIWLYDQLLTKRVDEATFYGINGGSSKLQGFEMSLQSNAWQSANKQWTITLGANGWLASNRFSDFEDDGNNYSGNHLPGVPDYTFNAWTTSTLGKHWLMTISTNGNGQLWLDDANTATANAWMKWDAKLVYTTTIAKQININMELGAQNLLNKQYVSMVVPNAPAFGNALPRYYYPALPQHFYGTLAIAF